MGNRSSEVAKLPQPFFNHPLFVLIKDSSLVAQDFIHRKGKKRF